MCRIERVDRGDNMKKSIRNALKLTLKSWRVLFLFEIFYKGLGSLILIPLLHGWLNIGLSLTKINYISSTNIYRIFTSPGMMFFIITAIIVVAVVMIFEFNCLAICFNQARENKELGIIQLFKQGFSRSKRLLSPRNWILIPFTVVIIPFTQLILTSSFVSNLELPRFITEALPFRLEILYYGTLILLSVFALGTLFTYQYFTLDGYGGLKSMIASWKLSAKHRIRMIWDYILLTLLVFFITTLISVGISALVFLVVNHYYPQGVKGAMYLTITDSLESIFTSFSSSIAMFTTYAYVSQLYNRLRIEKKEELPKAIEPIQKHRKIQNGFLTVGVLAAFVAGVFLVNLISMNSLRQGDWDQSLASNKMKIIAHRGYCAVAPENTMPAFIAAIDAKADYIELDVQESKDGVVMVTHDSSLGRIFDQDVNVWEWTKDELQTLHVNSSNDFNGQYANATVPTLEDVLKLCRGRIKVLIEPKPNGHDQRLAEATMEVVKKTGMSKDVQIHCLDYSILESVKAIDPTMQCGFIISMSYGQYWKLPAADFFTLEQTYLSKDEVAKVHLAGKDVYIWTVNTESDMQRSIGLGGDAMITNYPIRAREEIFASDSELRNFYKQLLDE